MAELLFRLNGVPEDEAEDVRELLKEAGIEFYETSAGNWGVSLAAIWLADDQQLDRARRLIDDYQQQRQQAMRQAALEQPPEAFWQRFLRQPLQVIAILVLVGAILYISIVPFLWE